MMAFYKKYLQQPSPKKESKEHTDSNVVDHLLATAVSMSKQKRSLLDCEDVSVAPLTVQPKKKLPPGLPSKGANIMHMQNFVVDKDLEERQLKSDVKHLHSMLPQEQQSQLRD